MLRRRRGWPVPRRTLVLAVLGVVVVVVAGVVAAVLLRGASAPSRASGDSFLDGDDDPIPTTEHTVDVDGPAALTAALAAAGPGTTLVLADGTYDGFTIRGVAATPEAPLVVRAAHPGRAVVGPGGTVRVRESAHVVVTGLTFTAGATNLLRLESSHDVRVAHNTFTGAGAGAGGEGASRWLQIGGADSHHNRVDHNTFADKSDLGNFLTLDGSDTQVSRHDRIDHNRFVRIGPRVENGKEAVRLGWSGISMSSGFTVLEDNLFEECDGDPEVVSVKASDMTIRDNVVRRSQGVLSLRHGDRNSLSGNVILGEGRPGTGGIRMYGVGQRVFNNYVAGTTGRGHNAALTIDGGDAEPGGELTAHHRVDDAVVVFNTLVDNATGIVIGENYPLPPVNPVVENNLLADSGDVTQVRAPVGGTITTNTVGTKADAGLVEDGPVWRLASGSPQIDRATGTFDFVTTDVEGRPRTDPKDIGAEEYAG